MMYLVEIKTSANANHLFLNNMNDSTLDLFCDMTDDKQHMIDTMRDTYWKAMTTAAEEERNLDAISVFEEWVVDGEDPEDGEREFTFIADLTRLVEDN